MGFEALGFELYHYDDLSFDVQRPRGAFKSYTAFRNRVEHLPVRPSLLSSFAAPKACWKRCEDLPELKDLSLGSWFSDVSRPFRALFGCFSRRFGWF